MRWLQDFKIVNVIGSVSVRCKMNGVYYQVKFYEGDL